MPTTILWRVYKYMCVCDDAVGHWLRSWGPLRSRCSPSHAATILPFASRVSMRFSPLSVAAHRDLPLPVCDTPGRRCLYLEPMDSLSYFVPRSRARSSLSPALHDASVFVRCGGSLRVLLAFYQDGRSRFHLQNTLLNGALGFEKRQTGEQEHSSRSVGYNVV